MQEVELQIDIFGVEQVELGTTWVHGSNKIGGENDISKKKVIVIVFIALVVSGAGVYLYKDGAEAKLVNKENVKQLYLIDFNSSNDYEVALEEYDRIVEYFDKLTIIPILNLPFGGTRYNLKIYYDRGKLQSVGISGDHVIDIDGKHYRILINRNDSTVSDFMDTLDKENVIYK